MKDCKLDVMLSIQKKFNDDFIKECWPTGLDNEREREKLTQYFLNLLQREIVEVWDETNYKKHVFTEKEVNRENVKEELIDCLKFLFNLFLVWGIDPDELFAAFLTKSSIVQELWDKRKAERDKKTS